MHTGPPETEQHEEIARKDVALFALATGAMGMALLGHFLDAAHAPSPNAQVVAASQRGPLILLGVAAAFVVLSIWSLFSALQAALRLDQAFQAGRATRRILWALSALLFAGCLLVLLALL